MSMEEVVKAMMVIRDWCESRDALEFRCHECPMKNNCDNPADIWEVEE